MGQEVSAPGLAKSPVWDQSVPEGARLCWSSLQVQSEVFIPTAAPSLSCTEFEVDFATIVNWRAV